MILWIDEFGTPHITNALDSGMIEAINDSLIDVYRFDISSGKYQKHNGTDWVFVE